MDFRVRNSKKVAYLIKDKNQNQNNSLIISFNFFYHFLGSGKSRILIEMIIKLIQSQNLAENRQIKILVTGSSASIDSLMNQLQTLRGSFDAGKFCLNFYSKKNDIHSG